MYGNRFHRAIMASEPAAEMENVPIEAFSTVWVKMEVDENGTVEGIEEEAEDSYKAEDNDQEIEDNYQETEDNSQEAQEIQALPRRSRRYIHVYLLPKK